MSEQTMSELIDEQEAVAMDIVPVAPLPGVFLAAQRQALGWSVEHVAGQLKLAPRQILSLESDDYAALPGISIVKGFIRAYAKVLRLDAIPLLAMLPQGPVLVSTVLPIKKELSAPFSEARLRTIGKPGKSFKFMAALALGIVIVAGLVMGTQMGYLLKLQHMVLGQHNKEPIAAPVAASVTPISAISSKQEAAKKEEIKDWPATNDIAKEPATAVPQLAASLQTAVADATSVAAAVTATPPVAQAASNNDLILLLREDSWIDVKRSNGSSLISRVVKAGATETLAITEPVQLIVGNVNGVEATLRGVALELKSGKSNTARLNLK